MKAKNWGFTLIELLITVLIAAILAAVAYPSYTNYVQKSRRSDAHGLLMDIAARQERFYFDNGRYATKLSDLKYSADTVDTPEAYYSVTFQSAANESYQATATPAGAQSDDACGALSLDQLGQKTRSGTADISKCW